MSTRRLCSVLLLLLCTAGPAHAVGIDAIAFGDRSSLSSTIATSALSTTSPNELLLAFVSCDSTGAPVQVTGISGAGLTWVLVVRTNTQLGTAEIWRAFASTTLSNVTVTASLSQSVAASMTVVSFSGVDTTGTNGAGAIGAIASASAPTGAPSASLVTTRANSYVFAVGTDWDNPIGRTVGSGQTLVHQYLATVGDTYWVQRVTSPIAAAGTTVVMNDTAPTGDRWNLSLCEIVPAGTLQTYALSGAITPPDDGNGALLTLSGSASQTTTADANGAYAFSNLTAGTYTVTPSKSGYVFNPPQKTVTIAGGDQTGVSFTAQLTNGNPIAIENTRPGSANWRLTNPSYAGEIEGYASATSVNRGSPLTVYVNSNGAPFTLDLYRLGWYQGLGSRLISSLGPLPGQAQPACPQDSTFGLIECHWTATAVVTTDPAWTSGVYVAKIRRSDTGKDNYVTFVVRDDASTSEILFDSNVNTMQAYNGWGGKALYAGLSSPPQPSKSISNAAVKVSFDRPYKAYDFFGPTDGEDTQFLRWEYQMVRWLESQGFDVSYSTNVDTTINGAMLPHHRVYLSAGHTEYWPSAMRNNVEAAMNAGVHLAFFTANTSYWQVRYETSSSGVPNRVMVGYKESGPAFDPLVSDPSQSTTRFRDSYIGRPENRFLGAMYGAYTTTADGFPFVVSNSTHPFFRNTGLTNGSAMPGLVGDEWDNVNGTPESNMAPGIPNLVVLSSSPTSAAAANAVVHQEPSGALVFDAGTFQWSWGLDNTLTPIQAVDARVGQITANVLLDMGATPATPVNITVSRTTFAVAGTVTAGGTASVTLAGGGLTRVTATDAAGHYSFTTVPNGTYTVTPSLGGATFTPSSRTITVNGGDVGGVDFAQAAATYALSGAISPAAIGVDTVVQLSGASTGSATADSTGAFRFTALANGTYTVTPVKAGTTFTPPSQTVTISGADATGVNFTAQTSSGPGLAIDVTTFKDRSTQGTSIASSAFSLTAPNELLLAFIATDGLSSNMRVSAVTGGGLTWVLVGRANGQLGTAEIWRAFAPTALTNITVTATLSQSVAASMTIMTFTGADPSGTSGSGAIGAVTPVSAPSGAPGASLTTTRANSLVVGVGVDWDNATARTLGPNQTMVHQYLATIGDTYWVQRQTATTPAAGTIVTINDAAPTGDRFNLVICEILRTPQ